MALPVILFVSGTCFIRTTQLYATDLLLLLWLKVGSLTGIAAKSMKKEAVCALTGVQLRRIKVKLRGQKGRFYCYCTTSGMVL
jgi:hypothetical protein